MSITITEETRFNEVRCRVKNRRDLRYADGTIALVKPEADLLDGREFQFRPGWQIDDTDLYEGEWAMLFTDLRAVWDEFGENVPHWIASGDLEPA